MKRALLLLSIAFTLAACVRGISTQTDDKLVASQRIDCDVVRLNPDTPDASARSLSDREAALEAARLVRNARGDVGTFDGGTDGGDPCK